MLKSAREALSIVVGAGLRIRERRKSPPTSRHEHDVVLDDHRALVTAVIDYIEVLERNHTRLVKQTKKAVSLITYAAGRRNNTFVQCPAPRCPHRMRKGRELCIRCWQAREFKNKKSAAK